MPFGCQEAQSTKSEVPLSGSIMAVMLKERMLAQKLECRYQEMFKEDPVDGRLTQLTHQE